MQTILITCPLHPIGRFLLQKYAPHRGCQVILLGQDREGLHTLAEEFAQYPATIEYYAINWHSPQEMEGVLEEVFASCDRGIQRCVTLPYEVPTSHDTEFSYDYCLELAQTQLLSQVVLISNLIPNMPGDPTENSFICNVLEDPPIENSISGAFHVALVHSFNQFLWGLKRVNTNHSTDVSTYRYALEKSSDLHYAQAEESFLRHAASIFKLLNSNAEFRNVQITCSRTY